MKKDNLIIELIENGYECEYLDFKSCQYNKEKHPALIKDIMAMANSYYEEDKYIIIGIKCKPNGEKDIIGISKEEFVDVSIYQQVILENIEPEIRIDYLPFQFKDKLIGIIIIRGENKERPYMAKKQNQNLHIGQCYIRKGANNTNAVRKDFDIFYSFKEQFQLKFMDRILAAVYPDEGCARVSVTMRNYTKLPIVIMGGELLIYNSEGKQITNHPVFGFDNNLIGADFKLSFSPME